MCVHFMCRVHKHFILKKPSGSVSHWWHSPSKGWVWGSDTSFRHFHPHICLQRSVWERERTTSVFFIFDVISWRNKTDQEKRRWSYFHGVNDILKVPTNADAAFSAGMTSFCSPDGGLLATLMCVYKWRLAVSEEKKRCRSRSRHLASCSPRSALLCISSDYT